MDAKTFIERLYTDTAEEHLRTTSQAKEDLITALPEITKLLPTREAQLFEQVFQELSDKISQLQDTESSTHPAASVWEEFSADYENIELQLRIAGTTVNEAEKDESLRRAIIVARDASDKLTMNMVFHGMNHDIWEKQEEYIQVASHVIAQMLEKEEIRPLDLFVKRSRETVEETRRMNPARGEGLFAAVARITEDASRSIKEAFELAVAHGLEDSRKGIMKKVEEFCMKMDRLGDKLNDQKIFFGKSWNEIIYGVPKDHPEWAKRVEEYRKANPVVKLRDLFDLPGEDTQKFEEYDTTNFHPLEFSPAYWKFVEYKDALAQTTEPAINVVNRMALWAEKKIFLEFPLAMEVAMSNIGEKALETLSIPRGICQEIERGIIEPIKEQAKATAEEKNWYTHKINETEKDYRDVKDKLLTIYTEIMPLNPKDRALARRCISDSIRKCEGNASFYNQKEYAEEMIYNIFDELEERMDGNLDALGSSCRQAGMFIVDNEKVLKNIVSELSPLNYGRRSTEEIFEKVFHGDDGEKFKEMYSVGRKQINLKLPDSYLSDKALKKIEREAEKKEGLNWGR